MKRSLSIFLALFLFIATAMAQHRPPRPPRPPMPPQPFMHHRHHHGGPVLVVRHDRGHYYGHSRGRHYGHYRSHHRHYR